MDKNIENLKEDFEQVINYFNSSKCIFNKSIDNSDLKEEFKKVIDYFSHSELYLIKIGKENKNDGKCI